MRAAAIIWCSMVPGLQVYMFRRIKDDLIKNHMEGPKGFRALLASWEVGGFVSIVEEEIRFWNGSRIFLCHCKDEKDRFKYQGAEIHVLLIDELTHFTEVIYRFLRTRVRAVGLKLGAAKYSIPRILCGSNPGNVGHQWVKKAFVDAGPFAVRRMEDEEGGMLRQFIPAKLDDNPSMTEDDPTYRARLKGAGSASLVKALEDGDWNVIEGAFFDGWRTEKHVIAPFDIPPHWARIRGFDWGFAKPFAVQWWAVASEPVALNSAVYPNIRGGDTEAENFILPRGGLVLYREWYGSNGQPDVGLRMEAEDIARGIVARETIGHDEKGRPVLEKIAMAVADTQIFAQDGAAYGYRGPTIGERMNKVLGAAGSTPWLAADKSRRQGWDQMRGRLAGDLDGNPMMVVFDTATDFIRTVPALQHDPLAPEDLDTDSEDHGADCCRYVMMSRPWARPTPKEPGPLIDTQTPTLAAVVKATQRRRANQDGRI